MHYPLASSTWDEAEYAAMQRVIDSGMFSMGKEVAQFEKEFAAWSGSRFAVMVNSGSSANLAMIGALIFRKQGALKQGDEVIVPAVSWSTTYYPLQQYGLKLKFVDIDRNTLNMDLSQLEAAIVKKPAPFWQSTCWEIQTTLPRSARLSAATISFYWKTTANQWVPCLMANKPAPSA